MKSFTDVRHELAEGPVWHAALKRFFWVDIFAAKVYSLSNNFDDLQTIDMPDKVGCIVPTWDGHLLCALSQQLVLLDLTTQKITALTNEKIISDDEMFNDGKVDCEGRFWVGSKHTKENAAKAKLYCFDGKKLQINAEDITVGNGLDWNNDNTIMYYTDSPSKNIYCYDFDKATGEISNKRVFAHIDRGVPDGLTVDESGCIWGAHWEGSCVTCYSPEGEVVERIEMPCEKPTSCAFGGNDLKTMMITSSSFKTPIDNTDNGFIFFKDMKTQGRLPYLYRPQK